VPRITPAEAKALIAKEGAVVVDVRDAPEVSQSGRVSGAHHISRGMLEFRADESSPYHDAALKKDRPVIVYCASGGRSALAGKVLKDMGYARVYNLGGFKDWVDAGGAVDRPLSSGH
jgi:rhodanese-related sulfurtransferase